MYDACFVQQKKMDWSKGYWERWWGEKLYYKLDGKSRPSFGGDF